MKAFHPPLASSRLVMRVMPAGALPFMRSLENHDVNSSSVGVS